MQETPHASKDAGFSRCKGGGQGQACPARIYLVITKESPFMLEQVEAQERPVI